ncbi:MAG: SCO family protein [Streptosporangiaceae bacterium]|jgi:cytochrome oxidase Cu insertion factor (SCO1/SenC/PrrC family)
MGSTLQLNNPTVVAAFQSALIHQGIIALLIFFLLAMLWVSVREWVPGSRTSFRPAAGDLAAEPRARQILRIGFGVLWILDGLLQAQPAMPLGLASNVTQPSADGSPGWVRGLVDFAAKGWTYHPVSAAAAAVWIQIGIGIWLLTAARGPWSRLGGLASVGWGLVVWIFGEAFGGIFAPGLSWLFGAPGAALLYAVAGGLVALPDRAWVGQRLGRAVLAVTGLFLAGMALLQAWPGRGFWQGSVGRQPGVLAGMVQGMAQTSQPGFLSSWVQAFGTFAAAHGFAVNLVVVVVLAATGLALASGQRAVLRPAVGLLLVLCAVVWVLVQDLGVFGGLGTDPNSMVPFALLVAGGYLAFAYAPAPAAVAAAPAAPGDPVTPPARGWRDRIRPRRLATVIGNASPRTLGAIGALGVAIIGVIPLAAASASASASPILAQALDGSSAPLNFRAPAFTLTNQHGRAVSLASLRGKVVLLTFLDPVCTSDCPLIAQEFRQADQLLAGQSRQVELVAVVTNPLYTQPAYTQAFDRQEHMDTLPNWQYLTGSAAQLKKVWRQYGIAAQVLPAGGMIGHSDIAYVIDRSGRTRTELNFDPGPGTASTQASFAGELSSAARQNLGSS